LRLPRRAFELIDRIDAALMCELTEVKQNLNARYDVSPLIASFV